MGRRVVGGGWRLTGQKVWTSLAREADWAICLARTDPTGPRHRGLTFFLVDMHSDGIEIRPLREITGRAVFNEVFLDEVSVPDDCVLGEPGDGWRIARSALATERVAMGRGSALGDEVEGLISRVRSAGLSTDARVMEQLGALVAEGLARSVLDLRSALAQLRGAGASPGPGVDPGQLVGIADASATKVYSSEQVQRLGQELEEIVGRHGDPADPETAELSRWLDIQAKRNTVLTFGGGVNEIQRELIATAGLGLPRVPR